MHRIKYNYCMVKGTKLVTTMSTTYLHAILFSFLFSLGYMMDGKKGNGETNTLIYLDPLQDLFLHGLLMSALLTVSVKERERESE